jgi:hypothetical protein
MYPAKPAASSSQPAAEMAQPVVGIPISSPGAVAVGPVVGKWSSGLCACSDDCGLCKQSTNRCYLLLSLHACTND